LNAGEVLFIDDNARNVKAAEELGIRSIRFQSPAQLHGDLKKLHLL
jgi:2-haloacid dehalogenase